MSCAEDLELLPSPARRTLSKSDRRNSLESSSSEESSSISSDQVYEVAGSESESESESESGGASPTLSEIVEASKDDVTHDESCSQEAESSAHTEDNRDILSNGDQADNADNVEVKELDKGDNPDDTEEVTESDKADRFEDEVTDTPAVKVDLVETVEPSEKPVKSKRVIHAPVKSHPVIETESADLFHVQIIRPSPRKTGDAAKKRGKKDSKRRVSEREKPELDDQMDRYSTRALQNRISVKAQISATEEGKTARSAKKGESRRARDKISNPAGDDLRSRLQRYKTQMSDDKEKERAPKRNGDVRVTSTKEKTVVTLETSAPKRSEVRNGSVKVSVVTDRKTRVTNQTEEAVKVRSARRAINEDAVAKLDKASEVAAREMRDITSRVSAKSPRSRSQKEDLNNNDSAAPASGVEDSLSSWSARRRKQRELRNDGGEVVSGEDVKKSARGDQCAEGAKERRWVDGESVLSIVSPELSSRWPTADSTCGR